MAEFVFVSPGVFTREFDETTRPRDTEGVGPLLIGPRKKGPAFVPIKVRDLDEDAEVFGSPSKDGNLEDYMAYSSRLYLRDAPAPATVVRVLGYEDTGISTGYTLDGANAGTYAIAASGSEVIALIHSSGTVSLEGTLTSSVDGLAVNIEDHGSFTCSLNRNDTNYITKVLNTDPSQFDTKKHYVFSVFDYANKTPAHENAFFVSKVEAATDYSQGFITGSTTVVISQPFDNTEYDLFGFGSIYAGDSANTEIKVSIRDIKKSPNPDLYEYGTFTVIVRRFLDNDRNPQVLETYSGLTLDPESPNYILKRIGDRYKVWNSAEQKFDIVGDYPNKSRFVYVTPSTDLENGNVPRAALPFGFRGYRKPTSGSVADKAAWPSLPYVQNSLYKDNYSTKVYWGAEIVNNASGALNHGIVSRLKHLPNALLNASGTTDSSFSLKHLSASVGNISGYSTSDRLTTSEISQLSTSIAYSSSTTVNPTDEGTLTLDNIENTSLAKFTLPIYDGFDGVDIHQEQAFNPENMLSTTQYQVDSYRKAVDIVSNPEEVDMTDLFIPGVHANLVTDYALEAVEDRADAFYVMDLSGSTIDDVISQVSTKQLDTNYAAGYYPWVRLRDDVNNKFVLVPPSVVMPAVYSYNDRVGFPWFAPAGFTRGGLGRLGVSEAKEKLTKPNRDRLYENRVNPIATFSRQGVVVWGQKTFQVIPSALDRINVRRMLLQIRKLIADEGRNLVFEQNVATTWQRFENRVNPILERVRQNAGVEVFRVILDNRTTTEDLIERNIMFGKIVIKPSRTAEAVLLDFHITNNVAAFEDF